MSAGAGAARVEPLFLPGRAGRLFATLVHPAGERSGQGVLMVPAFAEEMNKARRMTYLLARRLAAAGTTSLLLDLHGTGDSEGEFGDARWETWLDDLERGHRRLREAGCDEVLLAGLRLGCALAVEAAASGVSARRLALWQPVPKGAVFLAQFLRLRLAAELMAKGEKVTGKTLKEELARGRSVEIAGYDLCPELASAMEAVDLARRPPPAGSEVLWYQVSEDADSGLGPPAEAVVEAWRAAGTRVRTRTVAGEPFWTTQEICLVEELVELTARDVLAA